MSVNSFSMLSKQIVVFTLLAVLSACATVKPPLTGIVAGRTVETLQSSVDISMQAGGRSLGGHAFLVFKEPDRFHLAVLSPFGLTMLEMFSDHDRLTCVVTSKQTAYSGLLTDVPEASGLKNVALLSWVVAPPPLPSGPAAANREITAPSGDRFFYDADGQVARKVSPDGEEVVYQDYHNVGGVAFPDAIVITNRFGARVKISFDEPQINQPLEDAVLTPNLEGLQLLPLSQFKGL